MARKPPPKHSQFKPGQSGNPLGAAIQNPLQKKLRAMTQEQLSDIYLGILEGKDFEADPNATVLQKWIGAIVKKAIAKGDASPLNILLDRVVGRVKEVRENTGDVSFNVNLKDYRKKDDK